MTDREALQAAYEAKLAELWKTMFNSYALAAGNASEQAKADAAFRNGLALARAIRDKASALL